MASQAEISRLLANGIGGWKAGLLPIQQPQETESAEAWYDRTWRQVKAEHPDWTDDQVYAYMDNMLKPTQSGNIPLPGIREWKAGPPPPVSSPQEKIASRDRGNIPLPGIREWKAGPPPPVSSPQEKVASRNRGSIPVPGIGEWKAGLPLPESGPGLARDSGYTFSQLEKFADAFGKRREGVRADMAEYTRAREGSRGKRPVITTVGGMFVEQQTEWEKKALNALYRHAIGEPAEYIAAIPNTPPWFKGLATVLHAPVFFDDLLSDTDSAGPKGLERDSGYSPASPVARAAGKLTDPIVNMAKRLYTDTAGTTREYWENPDKFIKDVVLPLDNFITLIGLGKRWFNSKAKRRTAKGDEDSSGSRLPANSLPADDQRRVSDVFKAEERIGTAAKKSEYPSLADMLLGEKPQPGRLILPPVTVSGTGGGRQIIIPTWYRITPTTGANGGRAIRVDPQDNLVLPLYPTEDLVRAFGKYREVR